ncbi:transcriptional regulator LytR [Gracilibacillus oryzae]|uniref:Transcriptional regulator LytR n=1 Tax=Gracilibacillus oryzae TaxID=1672701 RepID=A0A7C8GQV3_9BACI|nr:LCP family protein [Gracilibacillus oryzae]KAB8126360.1 transcriptional regulator LytR [Gracilibacillus oryzae]
MNNQRKRKKSTFWLWVVIGIVLITVLAGGSYVYSIYHNAKSTVNEKIHKEVVAIDKTLTNKKIDARESLNILLLGVDERTDDRGRSDAVMVLTLDPQHNQMQLISIPRDTRTEISGKGIQDKINHAYAFGGVDMSIDTVEEFLGIKLDFYIKMNMDGLSGLVDALGGITVNNDLDWHGSDGFHYHQGELHLDGMHTLGYVRMRKEDTSGDFGRTERQRQVIRAIVEKGISLQSITKINDVINVLGDNVTTNMKFHHMLDLMADYRDTRNNFTSYMLQGSGSIIDDTYYFIFNEEEIQKVYKMITEKN